jgi:hypothetical protein
MNAARVVLVALALTASPAVAGNLYRCSARDIVRVEDDGTLGRPTTSVWLDRYKGFFVDTDTGLYRGGDGSLEEWVVIQRETASNDFVASPHPTLVSASTDLLRIRAWAEKPRATFMAFGLSTFVTGTCEKAK